MAPGHSVNQFVRSHLWCANQSNQFEYKNNKLTSIINQFVYLRFGAVACLMHWMLVQFCISLETAQVPIQYRHYRLIVKSSIDFIGSDIAHTMYSTLDTINQSNFVTANRMPKKTCSRNELQSIAKSIYVPLGIVGKAKSKYWNLSFDSLL